MSPKRHHLPLHPSDVLPSSMFCYSVSIVLDSDEWYTRHVSDYACPCYPVPAAGFMLFCLRIEARAP